MVRIGRRAVADDFGVDGGAALDGVLALFQEEQARSLRDDEAVAAYLLDLMIASRRMAAKRGFRFLAYLIGVAAEESRLLMLGRSAVSRRDEA